MPKFKGSTFQVGDIVKPLPCEDGYLHPHLIAGENYTVEGYTSDGRVNVSGEFRSYGNGLDWDENWFELVKEDDSVESIRSKILSIRERRNDLLMEIAALDKEEAELVEKLKQQGFVLYEQNEPETLATEKKTVLYAEDIEEDMNDLKNWKVGDIIECIDAEIAPVGSLATITYIADDRIYRTGGDGFIDGCFSSGSFGLWKFHSRPL